MKPGETIPAKGSIELNEDAADITISVTNTSEQASPGDVPLSLLRSQ